MPFGVWLYMQAQSHTSNSIKPKARRSHQVKINIFGGERFYSGLPNFCASCAQKFSDDRQLSFDPRHLHPNDSTFFVGSFFFTAHM